MENSIHTTFIEHLLCAKGSFKGSPCMRPLGPHYNLLGCTAIRLVFTDEESEAQGSVSLRILYVAQDRTSSEWQCRI